MEFQVVGVDAESGKRVEVTIDGSSVETAAAEAGRMGIDVLSVARRQPPSPSSNRPHRQSPAGTGVRWWLVLPLMLLPIAAAENPQVTIWAGITILLLIGLLMVPMFRRPLRALFRVSPSHPVRATFKLSLVGMYAAGLVASRVSRRTGRCHLLSHRSRV